MDIKKPERNIVDFTVGCAIDVPEELNEEYIKINKDLVGKEFEMDEICYFEKYRRWLPSKEHLSTL